MAEIANIQLNDTIFPIKDAIARDEISKIPRSDLEATGTLEHWLTVSIPGGHKAQGLTTDGTYIYMASVEESDGISNPKMYRIRISDKTIGSPQTPPKNGHYNNMNYSNGYIYATGFNPTDTPDVYTQIYKYDYSLNSGTLITPKEKYWNFAIANTPYGTKYYIGVLASIPGYNVYQEQTSGTGDYYPFTTCPMEHGNGIIQGCAIYDNKWLCSIISDPRNNNVNLHSNDELRIINLTGSVRKHITLKHDDPIMLQDVCFIGDDAYMNDTNGEIYVLKDIDTYFRGYYEDTYPTLWPKPCFIYGNENGTESYLTGTYGADTGKLLSSFQIARLAMANNFSDASGFFIVRSRYRFPFRINPVDGSIIISIAFGEGLYSYDVALRYNRTSTPTYYQYDLAYIKGLYRNSAGNAVTVDAETAEDIQTACNNIFYKENSYIHTIVSDPTCLYTFTPTTL